MSTLVLDELIRVREHAEIPDGWVTAPLGDLGVWGSGGTPSKSRTDFWVGGTIPWVSPKDMKVDELGDSKDHITEQALAQSRLKLLPADTILFVVRGLILAHTFPVAITCRPVLINQDMRSLRPHSQVFPKYLFWALRHEATAILSIVRDSTHGTRRLESDSLKAWPILLPPLAEQKRIVGQVESLLARVNAARERLANVPAILRRFRQSVLAAACSGQLTADWRETNPADSDASQLLNRILEERKSLGVGVASASWRRDLDSAELGDLPESWTWATCGIATKNFDGKRVPVKRDDREKRRGDYPYYGASGVIDTINDYLFDGSFLLIGVDGANLLARSTPIAFQAHGKFWVNNHAHVVQSFGGIPLSYLELFFNRLDLQDYVTGSAQPKLTQANLNRIPVPLPPVAEQHEIIRRVTAMSELADKIAKRLDGARAKLNGLVRSTLRSAFRGQLVPTEAELARAEGRDYEPASVLLERIRAQRESEQSRNGSAGRRKSWRKNSTFDSADNSDQDTESATTDASENTKAVETATTSVEAVARLGDYSTDDLMVEFRAALWGAGEIGETELLREVARRLGYERLGKNIRGQLKGHLRAAIRRRIVARAGEHVTCPTSIFRHYDADFLRARLKSVMAAGRQYTRDDVLHDLARYLGFRHVTPAMRAHMKPIFNSALHRGELARRGQRIWRER